MHRRLDGIVGAEGLTYRDLAGLTLRSLAGEDALLALDGQFKLMRSALYDELDGRIGDEKPAVVILDTQADLYRRTRMTAPRYASSLGFCATSRSSTGRPSSSCRTPA
ncbi:MAG: hypothetical protein MUE98_00535 [Rhodobacteraceae bacterium]|jgi:hypothetical protein|nr:hypothetical protein [Paracoccaceae bacterium]